MTANSEPASTRTKTPVFWGVHAAPGTWAQILFGALPFVLLLVLYQLAANARHAENPDDKLLPGISQMAAAMTPMVLQEDARTGTYLFWADTKASLKRLVYGVGLAFVFALVLGLNMGVFRGLEAVAGPFSIFVSMIPPLALLPILFISLGVDEVGKVALIFIGTAPVMLRDVFLATRALPPEQLVKAQTLGASQLAHVYRIALPQVLARAVDTLRLCLGAAWLFLIAAEAIASTEGLGYRIFLVRRYLAMDVIIPYVAWITLLGFVMDQMLKRGAQRLFPWYAGGATR